MKRACRVVVDDGLPILSDGHGLEPPELLGQSLSQHGTAEYRLEKCGGTKRYHRLIGVMQA
jgi:hypothetical protein